MLKRLPTWLLGPMMFAVGTAGFAAPRFLGLRFWPSLIFLMPFFALGGYLVGTAWTDGSRLERVARQAICGLCMCLSGWGWAFLVSGFASAPPYHWEDGLDDHTLAAVGLAVFVVVYVVFLLLGRIRCLATVSGGQPICSAEEKE